MKIILVSSISLCLLAGTMGAQDLILSGGTVLTVTQGIVENGVVVIQNGKITNVGENMALPSGVDVLDVTGKFLMPGIVDSHTHIGLLDVVERTDPVTPQIWMKESLDPSGYGIKLVLAAGVTTAKTMHGSSNVIGGVNVTIKLKYGRPVEEMIVKGVRQQLKMAIGENPKRVWGGQNRLPRTRMGTAFVVRDAFTKAREYKNRWDLYEDARASGKNVSPPKRDARMETLKLVLEKKMALDCHVLRADDIVWIINFCKEFDLDLIQLSHCTEGYKVADLLAESGATYGGFVDLWGRLEESYDGCAYGLKIMHDAGVNVVINSDGANMGRYLNVFAAQVLKYNDLSEEDALKMITYNAAKALEMEDRVGSLEIGKDGDVAVFDKHPLDSTSKCVMTIIDGEVFFDYSKESVTARGGAL